MSRVFSDPEFLRQVHITPYDYAADLEAERWREEQASYAYRCWCGRERLRRQRKQVLFALVFSVVCFALGFLGASL
jgi:predicted SprT family Zn-dependent metalloprotease